MDHVRVDLKRTVGLPGGKLYGPGLGILVPRALAEALGLHYSEGEDAPLRTTAHKHTAPPPETPEHFGPKVDLATVDPISLDPKLLTRLPMDFPQRAILLRYGYNSLELLAHTEDYELSLVRGIGKATIRRIRDRLEELGF